MLEQLVESKSSFEENTRKSGFLLTTFLTVVTMFAVAVTYSLFAKDFAMTDESLEFTALNAPVIEVAKPPQPEIKSQPEIRTTQNLPSNVIQRREAFESVESSMKPPAETRGQKDVQAWTKGARISDVNSGAPVSSNTASRGEPGEGVGISEQTNGKTSETEVEPPPIKVKPKVESKPETAPKRNLPVTGGVMNGKATNLVKPPYPLPAKAVKASGAVNVQVLIDEKGNVASANAVSGHPLLRAAAEQAARQSKFSPTLLTGQPVKVTGVIVYNFTAQ